MRQAPRLLDYFKIHFIVILYAFTAILGNATEANALTIVFFRCVIAAAGLGLMLAASKKSFQVPSSVLKIWLLNGAFVSLHWLLFFGAVFNIWSTRCPGFLNLDLFLASVL